ncbi:hypothetical protein F0562_021875 [Nyssa sinensis]|uniref:Protein yippee-like n=1 Tax=Nyssa sinensis TaxID=561372 RepID=A0A5J5BMJ2_9ASTE|nr:hypothetical protein F0562_021875 [Nyssa sinensis]
MEGQSLVRLDQTQDDQIILCPTCNTHIALFQDFQSHHRLENGSEGCIFNNVVNVRTDDDPDKRRKTSPFTIADIMCNKCDDILGCKFIDTGGDKAVSAGTFFLFISKLCMWECVETKSVRDKQVESA